MSEIRIKTENQSTSIGGKHFENNCNNESELEKGPTTAKDLFAVFTPDSDKNTDDEEEPLPKKLKEGSKRYAQKYKKDWENKLEFKNWLSESVHGDTYFYCKFCKTDYRCGISEIQKHMLSKKHSMNSRLNSYQPQFPFRGLLCPVFTPFYNDRIISDVKSRAITQYAKYLNDHGIKGILVNDYNGEGMSLSTLERMAITEAWKENCTKNGQFLMVQIGGAPIRDVIELVKHAEKQKVGAIVVTPDLYNKPKNHLDLIKYIKIITDFSKKIPLLYHHNPQVTQVEIDIESFLVDITGELDAFVGIIYSTSDLSKIAKAANINQEKFVTFVGTDEAILGALASGFNCIMATSINFAPKLVNSIVSFISKGRIKEAQLSQNLINKTMGALSLYGDKLPVLKAAMEILTNICSSWARAPQQAIWEGTKKKMEITLRELGLLK